MTGTKVTHKFLLNIKKKLERVFYSYNLTIQISIEKTYEKVTKYETAEKILMKFSTEGINVYKTSLRSRS